MFDLPFFIGILYALPAIVIGFSLHEFAHAYAADRLGDPTPRSQGRLSISPATHIDPLGILLIAIVGFGWAKPVQVNRQYFKNPKRDDFIVSAAGPLTNLLIAVVSLLVIKILLVSNLLDGNYIQYILFRPFPTDVGLTVSYILGGLLVKMVQLNVLLFLFNLLPIPPLDGFHLLSNIIPPRFYKQLSFLYQYGTIILILFIVTPISAYVIGIPKAYIVYGLSLAFGIM